MEQLELSQTLLVGMQHARSCGKQLGSFLNQVKHILTIQPIDRILDIYPEDMKTYVHTKLSMEMLIVALFIIEKKLATTQVSTSCRVNKQPCGTHLAEYHSTEKEQC